MNRNDRRQLAKKGAETNNTGPTQAGAILLRDQAIALHQNGRMREAMDLFRRAIAASPHDPVTCHAAGLAYRDGGDTTTAIHFLERAVALQPQDPLACHNLGGLLFSAQRFAEARLLFERATKLQPGWALALRNLGATLLALNLAQDALTSLRASWRLSQDDPWLHYHIARAGMNLGDSRLAITGFERALNLDPQNFGFATALAEVCFETGHFDRAEAAYKHALMLRPSDLPTILAVADRLAQSNRAAEALILLDHARQIAPDDPTPSMISAWARRSLGDVNAAEQICRQLIDNHPPADQAQFLLGLIAMESRRFDLAGDQFAKVLAMLPEHLDAGVNDAYLALLQGDFDSGLAKLERRLSHPTLRYFHHQGPRWTGEALCGKTILVEAEQGFGDTLQFVRYLPDVARQAERVLLRVPPQLTRLLGGLPANTSLIPWEDRATGYDFRIEMMSLPLRFRTALETIPAPIAYLDVPEDLTALWRERLAGTEPSLRVGLVWAGNPDHQNDCNRSMPAAFLPSLLDVPGIRFFSLQSGPRAADVADLGPDRVIDLSPSLTDFAETAAAILALDLVIAVDTSVVHLAGALGRPVWLLLSTASEWRWLTERDDSPWYPTMRIFRQSGYRDWSELVARVARELGTLPPPTSPSALIPPS